MLFESRTLGDGARPEEARLQETAGRLMFREAVMGDAASDIIGCLLWGFAGHVLQ